MEKRFDKRNPIALRQIDKLILAHGLLRSLDDTLDDEIRQGAALKFGRLLAQCFRFPADPRFQALAPCRHPGT
jgi:hypothetical protein